MKERGTSRAYILGRLRRDRPDLRISFSLTSTRSSLLKASNASASVSLLMLRSG
jgi:hypothetical protein